MLAYNRVTRTKASMVTIQVYATHPQVIWCANNRVFIWHLMHVVGNFCHKSLHCRGKKNSEFKSITIERRILELFIFSSRF